MKTNLLYLLLIAFVLSNCEDIFENDISNEKIILLSPEDNTQSKDTNQLFWCEKIDDALTYQIQIVSPNFENIEKLVLDSISENEKINNTLNSGTYSWRIKATNGSSETQWSKERKLVIRQASDLSGNNIQLRTPIESDTSNIQQHTFSWDTITNANSYQFNLKNVNNDFELDINLETNSIIYTLNEGNYNWSVYAKNDETQTEASSRTILIDTTSPQQPLLNTPFNNEQLNSNVTFSWTYMEDNGSKIKDSLWVYSDSLLQNKVIAMEVKKSFEYVFDTGTYYWRVKLFDRAGNQSEYSSTNRFYFE
ncbi:hypothetical protein N9H19_03370 [Flavobacteriales bacterium]|nr:hypothetical protein [Flavobacteriales bacterium]